MEHHIPYLFDIGCILSNPHLATVTCQLFTTCGY